MSEKSKGNYIAGEWKKAGGESFSSYSPVDEEMLWEGHMSIDKEVDSAVLSARNAFQSWSEFDVEQRANYLQKYINLLEKNKEELAKCISYEIGKPFWESVTEVGSMIAKLDVSIDAYKARNKEIIKKENGITTVTKFKPHGVAAIIGPYNFPAHMPNTHIIPALLAGNTIVLKPSEKAPYTSEKVIQIWDEAGLPHGVINLVQGDSKVGEKLCTNNDVNAVFFTGSKKTGQRVQELCLNKKICAVEMGGNSPLVVWDTSNINGAVLTTVQSAFITSGQRCSSARRLIVPNNEFGNEFLNRLAIVTGNMKVGNIEDSEEPYMGPVKEEQVVLNILAKQEELLEAGAKPIVESKRISSLGKCYIAPGIIDVTDVRNRKDEEIVGPFVQVIKVNNFDEAIKVANDTCYGLAAGVITEDKKLYEKFEKSVQAGIINWNQSLVGASGYAPFGGIKDSGNYRPAGFLSTDYCVYAVASRETDKIKEVSNLPKGIKLN